MSTLNKVQLIGNMTAAAEIRETQSGQKVANFSIATNRTWKDAAGVKQTQSEFHNIVAWTNLADVIEKYTSKGKKIYIEGRLQTRSWEDQSGAKKYRTEIVAENVILLGSPGEKTGGLTTEDVASTFGSNVSNVSDEIHIDDIPF